MKGKWKGKMKREKTAVILRAVDWFVREFNFSGDAWSKGKGDRFAYLKISVVCAVGEKMKVFMERKVDVEKM